MLGYKKRFDLMTIVKTQRFYDMVEWVEYHLGLGFDRIVIFNNDSYCNLDPLVRYTGVDVFNISGSYGATEVGYQSQLNIANKFFTERLGKIDWALWLDDDEFVFIRDGNNIDSILNNDFNSISLYWKYISSKEILDDRKESLIDTFFYTGNWSPTSNRVHVKTLVNMRRCYSIAFPTAHLPIINGIQESHDVLGNSINEEHTGLAEDFYDSHKAYIYHYFHQTRRDWIFKINRSGKLFNGSNYYNEEFGENLKEKYNIPDYNMKENKSKILDNFYMKNKEKI